MRDVYPVAKQTFREWWRERGERKRRRGPSTAGSDASGRGDSRERTRGICSTGREIRDTLQDVSSTAERALDVRVDRSYRTVDSPRSPTHRAFSSSGCAIQGHGSTVRPRRPTWQGRSPRRARRAVRRLVVPADLSGRMGAVGRDAAARARAQQRRSRTQRVMVCSRPPRGESR